MPSKPAEVLIVSPSRLIRELLCDLLVQRCGVRVAGQFPRLDQCPIAASARIMLWDHAGTPADEENRAIGRLRASSPQLRIISIDAQDASVDEIVTLVRGFVEFPATVQERLTRLESEVLLGVASGLRSADIARRMRRSCKTVDKHRANVQRKLGLRNVAQLTAFAIHVGLLKTDAILGMSTAARTRGPGR